MPGGFAKLVGRARGPGRLADVPDALSWVGIDERPDRRDNSCRVKAHPGHVGEGDLPRAWRQPGTKQFACRAGHRDEDRLGACQAGANERKKGRQILLAAAVEERQMMETFVSEIRV